MAERPIDFVTKIGRTEIPFYTFVEGPINSRDVSTRYTFDPAQFTSVLYYDKHEPAMVVPEDVARLRHHIVSTKLAENAKAEKPKAISNGPNYGCSGVYVDEESEPHRVTLGLRPTWFFDHMGLAQSLDIPFFATTKATDNRKFTLREYMNIDPMGWNPNLPYVCGNNVSLVSSDGYFIWMNRGELNVQYPNRKGVPAGFGNRTKDIEYGVVSPRMTAAREVGEEAGVPVNVDKLILQHVGRPYDDLHTEISWSYNADMKADEILKAPRPTSKYEGRLFKIPFGLDELTVKHLKNPGEWVLAHWYVSVQSLMNEFGREKIIGKLNE